MPVVKADAYGHGAGARRAAARARRARRSSRWRSSRKGLELRRAGITQPILVMGWIGKDQLGALVDGGLTPNIHSVEQAEELRDFLEGESGCARAGDAPAGARPAAPVHLKLDTGMTRLGVLPDRRCRGSSTFSTRSKGTHFLRRCISEFRLGRRSRRRRRPRRRHTPSKKCVARGRARAAIRPTMIHTDNSAATLLAGSSLFTFEEISSLRISHVRPGLALYARVPGLSSEANDSLRDVMSFVSVVDQVKTVPAGTRVGYGGTFVCAADDDARDRPGAATRTACRGRSPGRGHVLIGGRRCPIAGRDLDGPDGRRRDGPAAPPRARRRGRLLRHAGGTRGSASRRSRRRRGRSRGRSCAASARACRVSSCPEASVGGTGVEVPVNAVLEALGRGVLSVMEGVGRFFVLLGQTLRGARARRRRRPRRRRGRSCASASTRCRSSS